MTEQSAGIVPQFTAGDRLRKARELTGYDQGPFADLIGVSRGTVSTYERDGIEHRKPIVLRAWALATGVNIEWLEHGIGSPGPVPATGNSEELRRLTEAKRARARATSSGAPTTRYLRAA